jgi:hypothetical protein
LVKATIRFRTKSRIAFRRVVNAWNSRRRAT